MEIVVLVVIVAVLLQYDLSYDRSAARELQSKHPSVFDLKTMDFIFLFFYSARIALQNAVTVTAEFQQNQPLCYVRELLHAVRCMSDFTFADCSSYIVRFIADLPWICLRDLPCYIEHDR